MSDTIYVLLLGYAKPKSYYSNFSDYLSRIFRRKVSYYFLDNSTGSYFNSSGDASNFDSDETNELFEFSGYLKLMSIVKCESFTNDDLFFLLNDTATDHHFWALWARAACTVLDSISPSCISGDLRRFSADEGEYKYFASWMFAFRGRNFGLFFYCLSEVVKATERDVPYYNVDTVDSYATHLSSLRRNHILAWLFNESVFRGWVWSRKFELMDKDTRLRKGLAIQLEHDFSSMLSDSGFTLTDLKSKSSFAVIANFIDRSKDLFLRICSKIKYLKK